MNHIINPKTISLSVPSELSGAIVNDNSAQIQTVKRNQILFEKGEMADRLFRVIGGQVALMLEDANHIVEVLSPGDLFGEEALYHGERLFTAKMLDNGRIAVLEPAKLENIQEMTQMALQRVSLRQSRLVLEISALKSMPPLQRLARLILTLPEIAGGELKMQLPWRKNVMAQRIGVRNETFSRLLQSLQEHGAQIDGKWIVITDLTALRKFSAGDPGQPRLRKAPPKRLH